MPGGDAVVIQAWHILVVVVLPLIGSSALLWRTWVKPKNAATVTAAEWRRGIERDIKDLRDRLGRHAEADTRVVDQLEEVRTCLTDIKVKLARIEERMEARER